MKTIFTLLASLIMYTAQAQLTLLTTIPANAYLYPACINSTWKYVYVTNSNDSIVYVNTDGSVYKVINVTWPANGQWSQKEINGIYQNFITNDGQVSYISNAYDTGGADYEFIYKEDGTQLFAVKNLDIEVTPIISGTDETWGISISNYGQDTVSFYSVPGTYCLSCSALQCGSTEGIVEPSQGGTGNLQVYPNPSNREATIKYLLPPGIGNGEISIYSLNGQLLRKIQVTGTTGTVLDNATQSGTYLYKLTTTNGTIVKKQLFTE